MSKSIVVESGMSFPVESDNMYRIEQSVFVNDHSGVKSVEFIMLVGGNAIELVEAKSSSPNPNNHDGDNDKRYLDFIEDLYEKFINSLLLYNALVLKRQKVEYVNELPFSLRCVDLSAATFSFSLVIKNHEITWLIPISDELKKKLSHCFKSWNISDTSLKVYNEQLARKVGIVV